MEMRCTWEAPLGVSTYVRDIGAGKPVLLLHGASLSVEGDVTWFRLIPQLAPFHRVLCPDLPGFGESDCTGYRDREQRAEIMIELVRMLDLKDLILIGHSEGGYIAVRIALEMPERVKGLIIVTSGATAPLIGDERDLAWAEAAAKVYDYAGRGLDEETFVQTEGHLQYSSDPEFEALLRRNYRRGKETGHYQLFVERGQSNPDYIAYTQLQYRTILPRLNEVQVPVLLIWGDADQTVPLARGQALHKLMPTADLAILSGGHWIMHEQRVEFSGAIQDYFRRHFLTR